MIGHLLTDGAGHPVLGSSEGRFGGRQCPGILQGNRPCAAGPCPINCTVTDFSHWTKCDRSCGSGSQERHRTVILHASRRGAQCPALDQTRTCHVKACPEDCVVEAWSPWTSCNVLCGTGQQTRYRRQQQCKTANLYLISDIKKHTQQCMHDGRKTS